MPSATHLKHRPASQAIGDVFARVMRESTPDGQPLHGDIGAHETMIRLIETAGLGQSPPYRVTILSDLAREVAEVDAVIEVDPVAWTAMDAARREAIADEALYAIEHVRDVGLHPMRNANGRVKLRVRKADVQISAYAEVARRRRLAWSAGQIEQARDTGQQLVMEWAERDAASAEADQVDAEPAPTEKPSLAKASKKARTKKAAEVQASP